MPTRLPPRRPEQYPKLDAETKTAAFAVFLLLATLTLACHKFLPPLPGYSPAASIAALQLSP